MGLYVPRTEPSNLIAQAAERCTRPFRESRTTSRLLMRMPSAWHEKRSSTSVKLHPE